MKGPHGAAALDVGQGLVEGHAAVAAQPCDSERGSAIESGVAMEIDAAAVFDQRIEVGEGDDQPVSDIVGAAVLDRRADVTDMILGGEVAQALASRALMRRSSSSCKL